MARPGITYHEVANAAQELFSQGINPTVESVRQITGTGSNGTIAAHLRTWRGKLDETKNLVLKSQIPEELLASLKGLWVKVTNEASDQIEAIKSEVEAEIKDLREKIEVLTKANTTYQQDLQALQEERSGLVKDKVGLEQAVIDLQKHCALLDAKAEALNQQLEEKENRLSELQRLHQQTQANLEHYRETTREQRLLDEERHRSEVHQLNSLLRDLKQENQGKGIELKEVKQNLHTVLVEKEQLNSTLEKTSTEFQSTMKELDKLKNVLGKKELVLQKVNSENDQYSNQLKQIEFKHEALQKEYNAISIAINQFELKEKTLTETNNNLVHERWQIVQEKAQLEGQVKQLQMILESTMRAEKSERKK